MDFARRMKLPLEDPVHVGLTTLDAKDPDTQFPPIEQLRPPPGAPNVLIVLIDDVGFGASSAFGGPISTPSFGRAVRQRIAVQPRVEIDVDQAAADTDHLISTDERYRIALARQ